MWIKLNFIGWQTCKLYIRSCLYGNACNRKADSGMQIISTPNVIIQPKLVYFPKCGHNFRIQSILKYPSIESEDTEHVKERSMLRVWLVKDRSKGCIELYATIASALIVRREHSSIACTCNYTQSWMVEIIAFEHIFDFVAFLADYL